MSESSFRAFALAFRGHFFAAMSGGFSVPFGALAVFSNSKYQQLIWAALAFSALCFAAYRIWKAEREKVIDLENKLAPKESDIDIDLDGLVCESVTDENNNRLPSSMTFSVKLTNRGDKFLQNCQLLFGVGHVRYPASGCFGLRPGEKKRVLFLRTKNLPMDHRENRHSLLYFLRDKSWKIMADGPAWLVAPGSYEIEALSEDTSPALLNVKLSKEDSWTLEKIA